jgi:hypothetical protein
VIGDLERVVRDELTEAGMLTSWQGAVAVKTARLLDAAPATTPGASFASATRDLLLQMERIEAWRPPGQPSPDSADRVRAALSLIRGGVDE